MIRRRWLVRCTLVLGLLALVGGLGWAGPAAASAEPGRSAASQPTFPWPDPGERDAFKACVEMVHWVADDRPGLPPHGIVDYPVWDPPGGIDGDLWGEAIDRGWLLRPHRQTFTYRPNCQVLLPDDYVSSISVRYYSEVFSRCLAVAGGDTSHERPSVVPAWYWEVSVEIEHCYLLLPLGAFGLGDDTNAWSEWTADDEVDYPDSNPNPNIVKEYEICRGRGEHSESRPQYIDWRMDHGQAGGGGPGDLFADPPRGAVPDEVWHRAIHFYVNPAETDPNSETTKPATWNPNCELILLVSDDCRPSGPDNRALLPEQCLGPHPLSNYDIGYSAYDDPQEKGDQSIPRHLWGGTTNFTFSLGAWGIRIANWAVDWAYGFDIQAYDRVAISIGDAYQTHLLGDPRLRLDHLFWVLLVGWAAYMSLTGKAAVAGSEILVTVILLMVSGALLENREMYMDATWRLVDKTSTALLVAGMGQDAGDDSLPDRDRLVDDLQRQVQFTFVEEPYDYLNWGRALGDPNAPACSSAGPPARPEGCNPLRDCAAARYAVLAGGPHGGSRLPRDIMRDSPECREREELIEFNRDPNGTRLMGALLVTVSSFVVAALLIVMGLTVVVAKLVALLLFAVLPFVVGLVVLPASGRRLWWSWVTTLLQMVLAAIGMSFLLSMLLLTLNQLTSLTTEVDLIERFALMDILVLIIWVARRSLLRSGQTFAGRLGEYVSATRGTGVTWREAAAVARGGVDLRNVDRSVGLALGGPLNVATSTFMLRMHERRAARRGYRNLTNLAEWKRDANYRKSRRDRSRRRQDPLGTPRRRNFPLP